MLAIKAQADQPRVAGGPPRPERPYDCVDRHYWKYVGYDRDTRQELYRCRDCGAVSAD